MNLFEKVEPIGCFDALLAVATLVSADTGFGGVPGLLLASPAEAAGTLGHA